MNKRYFSYFYNFAQPMIGNYMLYQFKNLYSYLYPDDIEFIEKATSVIINLQKMEILYNCVSNIYYAIKYDDNNTEDNTEKNNKYIDKYVNNSLYMVSMYISSYLFK